MFVSKHAYIITCLPQCYNCGLSTSMVRLKIVIEHLICKNIILRNFYIMGPLLCNIHSFSIVRPSQFQQSATVFLLGNIRITLYSVNKYPICLERTCPKWVFTARTESSTVCTRSDGLLFQLSPYGVKVNWPNDLQLHFEFQLNRFRSTVYG